MFRIAVLCGLIGLAAATAIIIKSGYVEVLAALETAGWGILWTSLLHLIPMTCCIIGWRALLPGKKRPTHAFFLYVLWIRAAINNLLPVARVGGEVIAVRVMTKYGVRRTTAIACTVVETTLSVLAVLLFDIFGTSMFAWRVGDRHVGWQLLLGIVLSLPVIIALILVQRFGFFVMLSKMFDVMFRTKWGTLAGSAVRLDRAVTSMYRRRLSVAICFFWQFMAWALGSIEIWVALRYLGNPLSAFDSFIIEALIQAAASAAFIVPAALGVQEAGFLFFGQMLGLTPEAAIALALMRRCRDLLLYVPGLIVWQIQESRWLIGARKRSV